MKSEGHFPNLQPPVLTGLAKKAKVLNKAFPPHLTPLKGSVCQQLSMVPIKYTKIQPRV